jgi:hypothetical protein
MKKLLFLLSGLLINASHNAQVPIFNPSMDITSYGIVDSPFGEEVDKIIDDDINTKFLDFELDDGMGFTVDLGGLSYTATSIRITTANDFEERDPTEFEILGSNDGSTFTSITLGIIDCIPDRFFTRTYDFVNDTAYMYYRINYTLACDPTGGDGIPSMQVAETQLFGTILGIENNVISDFSLSPNPVYDFLMIETQQEIENIKVYNLQGQLIKEDSANRHDVSSLKTGLYFVQVTIEGQSLTKKFFKK